MRSALLLLAVWSAAPFGPCPPGRCRAESIFGDREHLPELRQDSSEDAYRESIVRVGVINGGCRVGSGWGSGFLAVRDGEHAYVITANHVIRGAGMAWVNDLPWPAVVVRRDEANDLAALEVIGLEGAALVVEPTDRLAPALRGAGYGGDGVYREFQAATESHLRLNVTGPNLAAYRGESRRGDSGVPLRDGRGHVVGVHLGRQGKLAYGVVGEPLRRMVEGLKSRRPSIVFGPPEPCVRPPVDLGLALRW